MTKPPSGGFRFFMGMNVLIGAVIIGAINGAINSSIYALPNGNTLESSYLWPQLLKYESKFRGSICFAGLFAGGEELSHFVGFLCRKFPTY